MTYVYACDNKDHPRWIVKHSMLSQPFVFCAMCNNQMHRVPQPFRFYQHPGILLMDKLDAQYRAYRARKAHAN